MASSLLAILFLAALVQQSAGFGYDATVVVDPGKKECYYQEIAQANTAVEFEYQVRHFQGLFNLIHLTDYFTLYRIP